VKEAIYSAYLSHPPYLTILYAIVTRNNFVVMYPILNSYLGQIVSICLLLSNVIYLHLWWNFFPNKELKVQQRQDVEANSST